MPRNSLLALATFLASIQRKLHLFLLAFYMMILLLFVKHLSTNSNNPLQIQVQIMLCPWFEGFCKQIFKIMMIQSAHHHLCKFISRMPLSLKEKKPL